MANSPSRITVIVGIASLFTGGLGGAILKETIDRHVAPTTATLSVYLEGPLGAPEAIAPGYVYVITVGNASNRSAQGVSISVMYQRSSVEKDYALDPRAPLPIGELRDNTRLWLKYDRLCSQAAISILVYQAHKTIRPDDIIVESDGGRLLTSAIRLFPSYAP